MLLHRLCLCEPYSRAITYVYDVLMGYFSLFTPVFFNCMVYTFVRSVFACVATVGGGTADACFNACGVWLVASMGISFTFQRIPLCFLREAQLAFAVGTRLECTAVVAATFVRLSAFSVCWIVG